MKVLALISLLLPVLMTLTSGLSIWDRADFNFFKGVGGENTDLSKLNSTQLAGSFSGY